MPWDVGPKEKSAVSRMDQKPAQWRRILRRALTAESPPGLE